MSLILSQVGQEVTIKKITGNAETKKFLNSLGFVIGEGITIVSDLGGNLIVNIKFPLSTLNGNPASQGFFANDRLVEAAGNIITKSDPGFVNYSGGDFTIKEDSSVYKENPDLPKIDFENIGLLKDESVGVKK